VSEQGEYAKGLETGLVAGKNYERERIIKILNEARPFSIDLMVNANEYVTQLTALIKGEQS